MPLSVVPAPLASFNRIHELTPAVDVLSLALEELRTQPEFVGARGPAGPDALRFERDTALLERDVEDARRGLISIRHEQTASFVADIHQTRPRSSDAHVVLGHRLPPPSSN